MLKSPIVAVQGGLGNQLSQWFFAHSLSPGHDFYIDSLHNESIVGPRNFELKPLIGKCSHVRKDPSGNLSTSNLGVLFHLLDRLWEFNRLRRFIELLGYFREDPRFDQTQTAVHSDKINYAKGYFQKANVVEGVLSIVVDEVLPLVQEISLEVRKKFDLGSNYSVIHARRGDYGTVDFTPVNIGTLSDEFFNKWSDMNDTSSLVLLTENGDDVIDLARTLKPRLILDKNNTSPWETLAIIYGASKFLGSNSSLSWWGARLCFERGGAVWLPSQWSYWKNINNDDYHFLGCNIANAFWVHETLES